MAGDNADVLPRLPAGSFDLIYMDPPFNTGRAQARATMNVQRTEAGDVSAGTRFGFGGQRYRSTLLHRFSNLVRHMPIENWQRAASLDELERLLWPLGG